MAYRNLSEGAKTQCFGFNRDVLFAEGDAGDVALKAKSIIDLDSTAQILIFDESTSRPLEFDFALSDDELLRWIASWATMPEAPSTGPGRPKLGVVAREVTLLPRHWEWLAEQPGGASVALRKLVDEARKANAGKDAARQAQEAAYRFIVTMAGDRPGFEEASRALFAGDAARFETMTEAWPTDIRNRSRRLVSQALGASA